MTLKNWVQENGGIDLTASKLGVTPFAVHAWLYRGNTPRAETMVLIHRLSKKRVSYRALVEDTFKVLRAKRG